MLLGYFTLNSDLPYKFKYDSFKFILVKKCLTNCFDNKKDIDTRSQLSNNYLLNDRSNPRNILGDMARDMEAAQNERIRNENQDYNLLDKCRRRIY